MRRLPIIAFAGCIALCPWMVQASDSRAIIPLFAFASILFLLGLFVSVLPFVALPLRFSWRFKPDKPSRADSILRGLCFFSIPTLVLVFYFTYVFQRADPSQALKQLVVGSANGALSVNILGILQLALFALCLTIDILATFAPKSFFQKIRPT